MGGSAGKIISPVVRGLGDVATFGTNELLGNPLGNGTNKLLGGGGGPGTGSIYGSLFGGSSNPYVAGPFSLDPNQLAADKSNIAATGKDQYDSANELAQQQFQQTTSGIPSQVTDELKLENPAIMESLNANHVLDSSAYPTEIARQAALLTSNLAVPAEQRLQDAQTQALQGFQGYQGGALQRGLSLEDQINNANISKSIGQAFAPQPPSGKAQFGTAAQGVGALAPWAKVGKAAA